MTRNLRPSAGFAALVPLLIGFSSSCGSQASRAVSGPPWNVVLICMDTVRADHLGVYGYARATTPALDELASRSLVFRDASATAGWTKPSVPSFLTGTYPCQHGVYEGSAHGDAGDVTDLLPADSLTLAEVFRQNGYTTGAFVHNAQLREGNGFEQGFDTFVEDEMDARELRWHGLDWLDRPRTKPFFLYLHFLDAHWPYPMPDDFVTRFAPAASTESFRGKDSKALYDAINDGTHALTSAESQALAALYDGALSYLDGEIGRFLAGLELRGLAADTVVCVIADHGEEFGEHGKVGHGHGLWENLLHVPWILRVPGRAPGRIDSPVSLIDLFPTLLGAAGLPLPAGLEGLDRLARPDEARAILAEHKAPDRYFQSLRVGRDKLLRRFVAPESDAPGELRVPIGVGTRWEAEFEVQGEALVASQFKPREEKPSTPPELKGRLDSLGPEEFRIAGLRVRYGARTERQTGPGTRGPELAEGLIVKVRGPVVDGALVAERIKFYPPEEAAALELRATVEKLDLAPDSARVSMGGFEITVTPGTDFKGVSSPARGRGLAREDIAGLLAAGLSSAAEAAHFAAERARYDLAHDPAELAPSSVAAGVELDARLDELGRALVQRRRFGAGDQKTLDAQAVQALKAIGYGGDER